MANSRHMRQRQSRPQVLQLYNAHICASCNSGYHKAETNVWQKYVHVPTAPLPRVLRTSHNAHICASCSTGYRQSGDKCVANSCTCANGNEATGADCTSNGALICASCKEGFYKSGNQCKACPANSYQDLVAGSSCSCNPGYHKSGANCVANSLQLFQRR